MKRMLGVGLERFELFRWPEDFAAPGGTSGTAAPEEDDEAEAPPLETDYHFIEFLVSYPDRTKVKGRDYVLTGPDGSEESGTLSESGSVRKEDVTEGTWTMALKDVEKTEWSSRRILCDEEAELWARVSGFPDGTAAKIRIFREFRETDEDVVDEIDATVENNLVEATWSYDYGSTDERKAGKGVAKFVAEVSVDDGACWAKTLRPLEVELETIVSARWREKAVPLGEPAHLEVGTLGFADGTEAAIEVYAAKSFGEDEKLADLTGLTILGGRVRSEYDYDGRVGAPGPHCTFKVTVGEREMFSDPVWFYAKTEGRVALS